MARWKEERKRDKCKLDKLQVWVVLPVFRYCSVSIHTSSLGGGERIQQQDPHRTRTWDWTELLGGTHRFSSHQLVHLCSWGQALRDESVCWVSSGSCWFCPGAVPSAERESSPEARESFQYSCVWKGSPDTRTKMEWGGKDRHCSLEL